MSKKSILALVMMAALPVVAAPTEAIHDEYNESLEAMVPLEQGWRNPPRLAKTRVWWWWLNGQTLSYETSAWTGVKAKPSCPAWRRK